VTEGRPARRWRRLAEVTGSAATALLVFGAVPSVLTVVVGDPLSHGLGADWGHPARVAMTVLALVAWVAWVAISAQLLRAVVQHVRRGSVGVLPGAPLTDRIAARIAIGVLALSSFGAPLAVVSSAGAAAPTTITTITTVVSHPAPAAAPLTVPTSPTSASTAYVVRPGDSLWSIADRELGDGADWTAIAALNLGRTMTDGLRFVDPGLIRAGWDLMLPGADPEAPVTADAAVTPAPPVAVAPVVPTDAANAPAVPASPDKPAPAHSPSPTATATPTTTAPSTPGPAAMDPRGESTPAVTPSPVAERRTPISVPAAAPPAEGAVTRPRSADLPELLALGLGAIGCAALARRARRRRLLQRWSPASPAPWPSDGAVDTDVLLQRFDAVPALGALETANCLLGQALAAAGAADEIPSFRAISVTASGVSFWLASPGRPAPPGFALTPDGQAWWVSHRDLDHQVAHQPYLPIVLPVGEDEEGTWLVPLAPGTCLPLVGPAAADLWLAARAVQEAWEWAAMVVITDDPAEATAEAERMGGAGSPPPPDEFPTLFFGDPGRLPATVVPRVSVVTLSAATASDLTVLVDRQAATIHPLGRTVRPHLLAPDTARLITELVEPPPAPADRDDGDEAPAEGPAASNPAVGSELPTLGPGSVEVKLLTVTPRLDGLDQPLAPNRTRRAVELVAYLALHQPDAITSDRLRTRVLGSADADAAAKTLFNTATAARRAMGADGTGAPLFPPGSRTGHYRVSGAVTVDVQRASALAALGNATEDPDHAIAILRMALSLVEGEPLANALSGYTWWESEGHAARLAAVLTNAAGNLAALAVDQGLFDLARWGLDQARLVDPYSEALSRAAMQVAAAEGDPDQLRREWRECQRRMDELDPGSSPSARTERLYGELAQQVLV